MPLKQVNRFDRSRQLDEGARPDIQRESKLLVRVSLLGGLDSFARGQFGGLSFAVGVENIGESPRGIGKRGVTLALEGLDRPLAEDR